ncbi:MAG: hypothetical protein ACRD96_29705 [Bryobacteraceae bacterium]
MKPDPVSGALRRLDVPPDGPLPDGARIFWKAQLLHRYAVEEKMQRIMGRVEAGLAAGAGLLLCGWMAYDWLGLRTWLAAGAIAGLAVVAVAAAVRLVRAEE